jgi:hypothetical protein
MSQRNRNRVWLATLMMIMAVLLAPSLAGAQRAELEKIIHRKVLSNGLEDIVV